MTPAVEVRGQALGARVERAAAVEDERHPAAHAATPGRAAYAATRIPAWWSHV